MLTSSRSPSSVKYPLWGSLFVFVALFFCIQVGQRMTENHIERLCDEQGSIVLNDTKFYCTPAGRGTRHIQKRT